MTKEITVTRWIDSAGFEHTTKASAEYEDARNTVLEIAKQATIYGKIDADEVVELVSTHDKAFEELIHKTRIFRVELGQKLGIYKP